MSTPTDYSHIDSTKNYTPPPTQTTETNKTSETTSIIQASKEPIQNETTAKTEEVANNTLDESHTKVEKPKSLSERVEALRIPQFLIGLLGKSAKKLPEFQTNATPEAYGVDADQMKEALGTALRRVKDSIQLNEDREAGVEGTSNDPEKIKNTEKLIQTKMENLLKSSLNIAEVYRNNEEIDGQLQSVLPHELEGQLRKIANRAIKLNMSGGDDLMSRLEPREVKAQEAAKPKEESRVKKMRKRAGSLTGAIDTTLVAANRFIGRGRSHSVIEGKIEAKEESISQTPEEKIGRQLNELQNLLPELGRPHARLAIKNEQFSVMLPSMLDSFSSLSFTSDLRESPPVALNHLKEMATSGVLIDTKNQNTEVSKNLLSQLNEIKNTDWGRHNSHELSVITEGLNSFIDVKTKTQLLGKIKAPLLENREEVKELLQPEKMKNTIKNEQIPFLLTGAANTEFASSFQKNAAYLMDPTEMGEAILATLELVNNQTDPEVKTTLMDNLVTSCMLMSDVYRENTLDEKKNWVSTLPDAITAPMTEVSKASNNIDLFDKLQPKSIQNPEEMQYLPELEDVDKQKELNDNTTKMMEKVRSGKTKGKYVKNVTNELRSVQSYYLGSIQSSEFRDQPWGKLKTVHNAPYIAGFGNASNYLAKQILDDVLASKSNESPTKEVEKKNLKEAFHVMEFYSEVMNSCIDDGNFAAANAIFVGLEDHYLERIIKRAENKGYDGLSKKYTENLERAKILFNPEKSFKNLRKEIEDSPKPCLVPIAPLYTQDYTYIDDGNKNKINNELNSNKLKMATDLFEKIDKNKPEIPKDFSQLQTRLFDPRFNLRSTGTGYKSITEDEIAARVDSTIPRSEG